MTSCEAPTDACSEVTTVCIVEDTLLAAALLALGLDDRVDGADFIDITNELGREFIPLLFREWQSARARVPIRLARMET